MHIRLPATQHARMVALAAEQGVSLNLLVATLLAAAVPFDFRPDDDEEQPVPTGGNEQPGGDLSVEPDEPGQNAQTLPLGNFEGTR